LGNLLTMQIRLYCRRPTRKPETGTERASQLMLPKQYSQDLGVIVSRLLEENVSRCLLLSVWTQISPRLTPHLTPCPFAASPTTVCNQFSRSSCCSIMVVGRSICFGYVLFLFACDAYLTRSTPLPQLTYACFIASCRGQPIHQSPACKEGG
jgi:hypothetical protein